MSATTLRRKYSILFVRAAGVGGYLLARILRKRGHKVSVVAPETVIRKKLSGYDLVLATTYNAPGRTAKMLEAVNIARCEGAVVLLGGPGFSAQPEAYLRRFAADFGLCGEADNTIGELFDQFERFGSRPAWNKIKSVAGVACRAGNNRVYRNCGWPEVSAQAVLDAPVIPVFQRKIRAVRILVQRGCPNRCKFCTRCFGNNVRPVDTDKVISLLVSLSKKSWIETVIFDGELFLPRAQAFRFLKRICDLGLNKRFVFDAMFTVGLLTRNGQPDEEYLQLLWRAGVRNVELGIESFSDDRLRELGKPQSAGQAIRLVRALQRVGIGCAYFLITLTPHTRPYDLAVKAHVEFALRFGRGYRSACGSRSDLLLMPGSALFEEYANQPERFEREGTRMVGYRGDMRKLALRQPLFTRAIPYDLSVDRFDSLIEALYVMELRLVEMRGAVGAHPEMAPQYAKLLGETRDVRRLVAKVPQRLGKKRDDHIGLYRRAVAEKFSSSEGFLKRWRISHPRRARLVEHLVGRKLFSDDWRGRESLAPGQRELFEEKLLAEIRRRPVNARWLPKGMLAAELDESYAGLTLDLWDAVKQACYPTYYCFPDEWSQLIAWMIAFNAKRKFLAEVLHSVDPIGHAVIGVYRLQLRAMKSFAALRAIREGRSSLEVIEPFIDEKRRKTLRRLAKSIPKTERGSHP